MGGNFTAALILDANSTEEQRDALTNIISRQAEAEHSRAASSPPSPGGIGNDGGGAIMRVDHVKGTGTWLP
jgi:hypothetical protein